MEQQQEEEEDGTCAWGLSNVRLSGPDSAARREAFGGRAEKL